MSDNQCKRVMYVDPENGNPVVQKKIAYKTLDEAIEVARRMNLENKNIHKAVAYKCQICHEYHVGKNRTLLNVDKIKRHKKDF